MGGLYTQASVPNTMSDSLDTALARQSTLRLCVRPCLHVCAVCVCAVCGLWPHLVEGERAGLSSYRLRQ
jgi:hypothetical protein